MKRLSLMILALVITLVSCSEKNLTVEDAEEYMRGKGLVLTQKTLMEGQIVALEGYTYQVNEIDVRVLRFPSNKEATTWVKAVTQMAVKMAQIMGDEYREPLYIVKQNIVMFGGSKDYEKNKEIYEALK